MLWVKQERDYLDGLAKVLREPNWKKVQLNLRELHLMSLCNGSLDEISTISGLLTHPKEVTELGKRLKKGSSLTRTSMDKIIKGK